MISPFPLPNLIKILISIQVSSRFFTKASSLLLLLILFQASTFPSTSSSSSQFNTQTSNLCKNNQRPRSQISSKYIMRIHPLPRKRNITIQYEMNPRTSRAQAENLLAGGSNKKLRRLPHIFSRVLELPFRSDADVVVQESPDCFKFVAETDGRIGDVVRAHMVEIHPGVTKIVIRLSSSVDFSSLDNLELDMWRFRLPATTRPELASAVYEDGELIVTVPKGGEVGDLEGGGEGNREYRGGMGNGNDNNNNNRLVLVQ